MPQLALDVLQYAEGHPWMVGFLLLGGLIYAQMLGWIWWKPQITDAHDRITKLETELDAVRADAATRLDALRAAADTERREKDDLIYRLLEAGRGAKDALNARD